MISVNSLGLTALEEVSVSIGGVARFLGTKYSEEEPSVSSISLLARDSSLRFVLMDIAYPNSPATASELFAGALCPS